MSQAELDPTSPSHAMPILEAVRRYWGYNTLRPLQEDAIRAGLSSRDSLVVMPTGGGKSLCYQVPPEVAGRTDVVVSPLISLMKDQVDGLQASGYPAAAIHSQLSAGEKRDIFDGLKAGNYRLLFVSPERLAKPNFQHMLRGMNIAAFAIDEAHCISHWGHDFRPEYRRLAELKQIFPGVSVHAFTATATPRVREDILAQLGLDDPSVLVGQFDRPNLVYRIIPRFDLDRQVIEVVHRHPKEAIIVYCISRKDTETLAEVLKANGINAAHYHAGMEGPERRRTQEAFAEERLDVVVATVAFGMGIDRSNVRCVIHAAMPKSIEHYQQETGRAGRDGLEAECVLLYSAGDFMRWQQIYDFSAKREQQRGGPPSDPVAVQAQLDLLEQMSGVCSTLECRHRALVRYFGQTYEKDSCEACDVCLGEVESMADSTTIARKVLSCVARFEQRHGDEHRFGVSHLVAVLRGSQSEQVLRWGHDQLTTHGILKDISEKVLTNLVYQIIDQGLLDRATGKYPVLALSEASPAVLRGEREVRLIDPGMEKVTKAKVDTESWEGVDRELFQELRDVRMLLAQQHSVPAFVIFGDSTLRDLARIRPTDSETMQRVHGVGEKKLADFGPEFLPVIQRYCQHNNVSTNNVAEKQIEVVKPPKQPGKAKRQAWEMFAAGESIDDVAIAIDRAHSTTMGYLREFIEQEKPESVAAWVDAHTYQRVVDAAKESETEGRLKPIYEHMNEEVDYDQISIVITHLRNRHDLSAADHHSQPGKEAKSMIGKAPARGTGSGGTHTETN